MDAENIQYRLFDFDDKVITAASWNGLLQQSSSDIIFMTWHWQKTWWEIFGRGKLLLVAAEQNGIPVMIAPLFADGEMIFFVGSGGSDYLDFIGDINNVSALEKMLEIAVEQVPGYLGLRFYHVLENSPTAQSLKEIAGRRQWNFYDEGKLPSPMLDIAQDPDKALEATRKKSLLRHEAWFLKNGGLAVKHYSNSVDILPWLDEFFEQHMARWEQTAYPSMFNDEKQRLFFKALSVMADGTGWLRFTVVMWKEKAIAFHFGFNYRESFFWYKPTFDISLANHSPGEVLLKHLLMQAIEEKAHTFDFGLGDEAFKKRFASSTRCVYTWGLYPPTTKTN